MNSDFKELLQVLNAREVEYLIIGGYAVIYHTEPRFTKDLDIWIRPTNENARRLMAAFSTFGIPLIDIEESDFAVEGTQYMIGVPPVAIDFLTSAKPLNFEEAWKERIVDEVDGIEANYLGKLALIASKQFADRDQDRADIRKLKFGDSGYSE